MAPIAGRVVFANNASSCLFHRRTGGAWEFATDIARLEPVGDSLVPAKGSGQSPADHFIYRQEVLAVGGGTVVATGTQFKNADCVPIKQWGLDPARLARLVPAIGAMNTYAGNYVTINHENGEFSFYAHLDEGSVLVKKGDRVTQGQPIGRVGTTGNSAGPHLHFQLMDGPDVRTANGLPVTFENISGDAVGFLAEGNCLHGSDLIFSGIDLSSILGPPPPDHAR